MTGRRAIAWTALFGALATASWLWLSSRSPRATNGDARTERSDIAQPLASGTSETESVTPMEDEAGLSPGPAQAARAIDEEGPIDIAADPPPTGSGDDRSHSGLPIALFDKRAALQAAGPTPERWDAVAARLRHPIAEDARERITRSFRKHDEEAALAIGHFRTGTLSEAEATATISSAQDAYRRETISALSLSDHDFTAIFDAN